MVKVSKVIEKFKDRLARDFSCLMCTLPREIGDKIYLWGKELIPDEDLHPEEGREGHIHVTIKYGIHINDPTKVRDILIDQKPIKAVLGKTSMFESDNWDVIKLDIFSDQLNELNDKISKNFAVTDTHPKYIPHVTIAYVKKGLGPKYIDRNDFEGVKVNLSSATFSGNDYRTTFINFPNFSVRNLPHKSYDLI